MDFEAYSGLKYQLPITASGEVLYPSSSEYLMQDPNRSVPLHMDSAFGTLSRNVAAARFSPHLSSSDMDRRVFVNNPYLAPDIPLQDASYMYRNNSNMESYLNLPMLPSRPVTIGNPRVTSSSGADHLLVPDQFPQAVQGRTQQINRHQNQLGDLGPMSQSNPRVTISSGADHLLVPDHSLQAVQGRTQQINRHQNQLGDLGPMSQSRLQTNQAAFPFQMKFNDLSQLQKRPRLDYTKDDVVRYMIQRLLMSESPKQLQSHDLRPIPLGRECQFPIALQKETVQFPSKSIEGHYHQSVTQPKQLPEPQVSPVPITSGDIYADRLMEYLHHQRHRPKQNSITYWRKFVIEFFDANAKKRWCLSKYDHEGCHAEHAFSQSAVDPWNCDLCGTKSGRGFEAKFDVLPRLCKGYFDNGVVEELLYLDLPLESKLPSGCVMLQYTKAVQETVYKHSRVVHEGQLCVTFTKESKIISWEFCVQRHEEFILQRSIAPQVKQLLQASQKCKDNIDKNKSGSNLRQSMQATNNRFVKAGQQLENIMESHVNESGLPKHLERFLRVAEVVDCMKDLITFSHENNLSPIESLNKYAGHTTFTANQMNGQSLQQDTQGFYSTGNGAEEAWDCYQSLVNHNSSPSFKSTTQLSNSTGMFSSNTTQCDNQDPRKYVLNKQLMQNMFNNGSPQDSQLPTTSQTVKAGGVKGRNATKTNGQRTPRRGSGLRGYRKKEIDDLEDDGVPMLPGVQVKKEVFFG